MSFRSHLRSALCLLLAAPLGFAVGAPAPGDVAGPVTVRVHSLPTRHATSPASIAGYRVVQRFLELNPDIRLESSTPLMIEGSSVDAAPLMAIAGGTAPDVLYLNFRMSDTYIQQGFLYPLDEYIATMPPDVLARRIPENVRPVVYRQGPGGKDHYWALPDRVGATVLLYRKDLFAAAGLDPEKPPQNWQEFLEVARAVSDPSKNRYAFGMGIDPNASWRLFPFLSSAGAEVVKLIDDEWRATFNSPEAIDAFVFIDQLQKEKVTKNGRTGPVVYRGMDAPARWSAGSVAMFFGTLSATDLGAFNPELIGVAPVPAGPKGNSRAIVNASMMGIFSGVKDQRVRDAAWKYISFIASREALKTYTDALVELNAAQLLDPNLLSEFGYEDIARKVPASLKATYNQAMSTAVPEPYGRNCQFIYAYVTRPIENAYFSDFTGLTVAEQRAKIQTFVDAAVNETNEKMLGKLTPVERKKRNVVGWIVAVAAFASFVAFVVLIFRWLSGAASTAGASAREKSGLFYSTVLVFPAVGLILLWDYYPLFQGSLIAFQDYRLVLPSVWVGISNFADALYDGQFWLSMRNASYYCLLWMLLGFLPPVGLALLLQEIPHLKVTFRLLFYIPAVVSGIVILFMWRAFYDPSPDGALNRLLGLIGISPQTWLQDPAIAMLCVVVPLAWANLGPGCLIYLAALKGIPDELYEAADIDGAGAMAKIRLIVIPYLRPLIVINAVGAIIGGFKSGGVILAMTGGGPNLSTQVVGFEIWQRSFQYLEYGRGAAMAWILALLLMAFTAYQMRVLAKVEFRTAK